MHLLQKFSHRYFPIRLTELKNLIQFRPTISVHNHLHTFISADGPIIVSVEADELAYIEQFFGLAAHPIVSTPPNKQLEFIP
jgi:hypothetical protein